MLSTSLKEPGAVFTFPPQWIPKPVMWENYVRAWKAVPFGRFYLNSIFVAVCVTFGQVFTSSLAAYAFARLHFPGRDKLFLCYLATMMIPGSVTMIPVFILLKTIGWIDTYWALIVPGIFSAYGTFMLRQFFMGLPKDLEDAAKIDGCSLFGIYYRVILPLSLPALATLTTFTFMGSWNSFMWPLIVINSMEKKTLPIGLASFQGLYTTDWTLLMAGSIIVLLPVLIVFIFNQRFFVKGIQLGAVKG
jgi:multiple sugar transport system permease protein